MNPAAGPPVITLLTDYGLVDEFVGVLHGVIARICPAAQIIDLSHGVPAQDVAAGAVMLANALPYLPVGVHVAVVDPGVGSDRRAVAVRLADRRLLVGPDNGLLWTAALGGGGVVAVAEISASPWRLEPLAATFHGRDIFAPVGAHLAAGEPLEAAGAVLDPEQLVRLEKPVPRIDGGELIATVIGVDRFGNIQLGALSSDLEAIGMRLGDVLQLTLASGEAYLATRAGTFTDVGEHELLLFEDGSRHLAVACNRGSAASRLGVRGGEALRVSAAPAP